MAVFGFWIEPRSLSIKSLNVQSPAWPSSTAPLRLIVLADFHVDNLHMPPSRVRDIVRRVNDLKPDLILLAGDYIGGDFLMSGPEFGAREKRSSEANQLEEEGLKALDGFQSRLGTYAVMGNHDCWWSCTRVREVLANTHVQLLENRAILIKRPGGDVWIVGLEDGQTQAPNFALASNNVPTGAASLVLTHNPGLFDWPGNNYGVQISGHTHAGQVRFPIIGGLVHVSRHGEETANGYEIEGSRILIVTRGLGESGLPVRFNAAPQIMELTISHGPKVKVTQINKQ